MNVLSLVTNRYATFYVNQSNSLEKREVTLTHISPNTQSPDYGERQEMSRTVIDYAAMYPKVLKESLKGYDLIHANNGKTVPFALAQPKRPIVLTLWGSDIMESHQKISRIGAKYVDKVIVPSSRMSEYLSCEHEVIPFGINTNLFKPINKHLARKKINWPQDEKIILFPYPQTRGVKRYDLAEQLVEDLDRDARLYSLSDIPHKEMPIYYNAADVVLITSKRESGPMVIKEAALCNVPIVSTDVGFAGDVLENVSSSYVCKSNAEIITRLKEVLESPERSNGRQKLVDDVSIDQMGKRILDVYQSVL